MPKNSMTPTAQAYLDFILEYHRRYGIMPTVQALQVHFDVSRPAVYRQQDRLVDAGFLKRHPDPSRSRIFTLTAQANGSSSSAAPPR